MIVLSRGTALRARRRAIVAPCTTTARGLPSEVDLDPRLDPVPQPCIASLDSVESVPTSVLVERLGALSGQRMRQVCAALAVAVDCR